MRRTFMLILATALAMTVLIAAGGNGRSYSTNLSGGEEVGPVETEASGRATFQVTNNGTALNYQVRVKNIQNVVAAHIHCAPAGVNGSVGVTLFSGGVFSGNGSLAHAKVTAPDAGNGCGWADLDDVIDALDGGDTYVNVHTLANLGGEIRGQIK